MESRRRRRKATQLELRPKSWGGKREGAGRPSTGKKYVPHRVRPKHARAHPVHVTLRARVSTLRDFPVFDAVAEALAKGSKPFFRVCEYSVQMNRGTDGIDACSSARWFGGRKGRRPDMNSPLGTATSWLLREGWRKRGRIAPGEAPRARFTFD